jgi:fumarylpyruvate hydrolase
MFEPQAPIGAAIVGDDRFFPVRRVFCIGRNYAEHAREMGQDPDRDPPFFFTKWAEAVVPTGSEIVYPLGTENYHWELELAVAIGIQGIKIPAAKARDHIIAYGVGLDMTRRDLQQEGKDKGRPWSAGKNVVQSAPLAPLHLVDQVGHVDDARIWLEVNGKIKQDANVQDMIWSSEEVIEHISHLYRLYPGDLILTGTPAGVGACVPGDRLVGRIEGLSDLEISIGPREA